MNRVVLSPSHSCNLKCVYCSDKKFPAATQTNLRKAEWLAAIESASRQGMTEISFGGATYGEPLINMDVEEMIAHACKQGFTRVTLNTNGLLLEERLGGLVAAGLTDLVVSLDTLDPRLYARLTGLDGFHKVVAALKAAAGKVRLRINTVVMKTVNEAEIFPIMFFAAKLGASVQFLELIHDESAADAFYHDHFVPLDNLAEFLSRFAQKIEIQKPERRHIFHFGDTVVAVKLCSKYTDFATKLDVPIVMADGKIFSVLSHNVVATVSAKTSRASMDAAFKGSFERLDFHELALAAANGHMSQN